MNNIFYDYYQKAQGDSKWFLYTARASETGIIDQEELDNALTVMGEAKFKQEFECSFTGNQPGSIYGDIISDLEEKKKITTVPYDPSYYFYGEELSMALRAFTHGFSFFLFSQLNSIR